MLELPFTRSKLLTTVSGLDHGFSNLDCESPQLQEWKNQCATAKQVHQDTVIWIESFEKAEREADGVGTDQRNLPVAVYTADCAPILFAAVNAARAPVAVMAVHAGWRGTAAQITKKALQLFSAKAQILGGKKILVSMGPTISKAAFEVGQEVVDAFPGAEQNGMANFFRLEGSQRKYQFDLPGENKRQLEAAASALPVEIDQLPDCTFSEAARYPSYRREKGRNTRILSFIVFR